MKINLKNRVRIILLMSITIPGFILGYLSLKTIQSEKTLLEKSLVTHREDFLTFFEQTIKKSETESLSKLKNILIQSSQSAGINSNFELLADILAHEMVEGALILYKNKILMPSIPLNSIRGISHSSRITPVMKIWIDEIQKLFRSGRYRECINAIDRFTRLTAHYLTSPMDNPIKTGFKVMKLNCYKYLGKENKTISFGTELITDFLKFKDVTNYTGSQYYLQEVLNTLTSMENLSREGRNNLWKISQQSKLFFDNVKYIYGKWQPNIEFIAQIKDKELGDGLEVFYIEGEPFLKVKFPWLARNQQIIIKIGPEYFYRNIKNQLVENSASQWDNISFEIQNLSGTLVSPPLPAGLPRDESVERLLNTAYLPWKIEVMINNKDVRMQLAQKKIFSFYFLLGLSFLVLIIGGASTLWGISKEENMIKMKSNFLSAVSHELKSPITSIRLLSGLLETGKKVTDKKVKKYSHLIGRESTRLQMMVENILSATHFETSFTRAVEHPVNLKNLLEEITGILQSSFDDKEVGILIECDNDYEVLGDSESLRSVFQNLLDNALKYSNSGTQVKVSVTRVPEGIRCIISDQGIGIPPESLKYIFDRFYRAEDEMTRKSKGSGLGLSLVKQIIEQHEAKISVSSKLNQGTEFTILFTKI